MAVDVGRSRAALMTGGRERGREGGKEEEGENRRGERREGWEEGEEGGGGRGGGRGRGQGISTCTIQYIIMPHNVHLNFHALSYAIQT